MSEQKWTVISAVSDFLPQLFVCSHRKNKSQNLHKLSSKRKILTYGNLWLNASPLKAFDIKKSIFENYKLAKPPAKDKDTKTKSINIKSNVSWQHVDRTAHD